MKQEIDLPLIVSYDDDMNGNMPNIKKYRGTRLPVSIEKGEDGFYVANCPVLKGCYTQGKTINEVLHNIREVALLVIKERENQEILEAYHPAGLSLHTIIL